MGLGRMVGIDSRKAARRGGVAGAGGGIVQGVLSVRRCSRTGCTEPAVATLTYVYADSTAVVGPLATQAEPHSYDLCTQHAHRLTAPRGWEVVRFEGEFDPPQHSSDDLTALAEAVREAGRADRPVEPVPATGTGRRGHLRVLPGSVED
jgi:Protein of unknown function (DUF3499)